MKIESSGFGDRKRLDDRFSYVHQNQSPALSWSDVPDGTKELALICDDPDAPGKTWVHWVIYGIPASIDGLGEGLSKDPALSDAGGAKQGKNDFGQIGYDGPAPPPGGDHRYFFKLYALSEPVDPGPNTTAASLRTAIEGKVLAECEVMGTYSR